MADPKNINALNYLKAIVPTQHVNRGTLAKDVVKTTAGYVCSLTCYNANASSRFLMLFDNNTEISNGESDFIEVFLVPAGSQIVIGDEYFKNPGVPFSNGLAWGFSTSATEYTAGTASDQLTIIKYK